MSGVGGMGTTSTGRSGQSARCPVSNKTVFQNRSVIG